MSLFSHAMTFLQRRTSRAHVPEQPDSRRRRERALRAASSLDLERSKSELELESTEQDPADMNPCGTLQADVAVNSDLAPELVSVAPTLDVDVQERSAMPNDSQPKHFFAVAQRARAEAFTGGALQEHTHLSNPSPVSKLAMDQTHFNGQSWEATPGQQNMAQDVVGSVLTDLESVIAEEKNKDLAAEKRHAGAVRSETRHEQISWLSPKPASELASTVWASNSSERENLSGHPGTSHDIEQATSNTIEPTIVEKTCQDPTISKVLTETPIGEPVPSDISLPAPQGVSSPNLSAEPRVGHDWKTTSGREIGQDNVNVVPEEPEAAIVMGKCEDAEVEEVDADNFAGQATQSRTFSPAASLASKVASNHEPFGRLQDEAAPGHASVVRDDVQVKPTDAEPAIVEEHCEGPILQKVNVEMSTGEAVLIQASKAELLPVVELAVKPEHPSGHEWEATSGQRLMVQADAQAEPTEPESAIEGKQCEHVLAEKSRAEKVSGDAMREQAFLAATSLIPVPATKPEPSSSHEQQATASRLGMAQDDLQAEPTEIEPDTAKEQCDGEKTQGQQKQPSSDDTEGCLQEMPEVCQSVNRVGGNRDKRRERLLRAASSLGPCSSAEADFPSPCRTESDLEQANDKESAAICDDTLHRPEASMLQSVSGSQKDLTPGVQTSDPSQVNDWERPAFAAIEADPSRSHNREMLMLESTKVECGKPEGTLQSTAMIPMANASFPSTTSHVASIARLDNFQGATLADPLLLHEGLVPEQSQVQEHKVHAPASVTTESEDEDASEMTVDEAESDEDFAEQTRKCQHCVEESKQQQKDGLKKEVENGQEQQEMELGVDAQQTVGHAGDKQEELEEDKEVTLHVLDVQEEQLEPSIQRASHVVFTTTKSSQGNLRDGREHHRTVSPLSSSEIKADTNSRASEPVGRARCPQESEAHGAVCQPALPCQTALLEQQASQAGEMQQGIELQAAALLCRTLSGMEQEPCDIGGVVLGGKGPAEAASALKEGAHSRADIEINVASQANHAPAPISTTSAKHESDCNKLQRPTPKLMQVANAKRRLVGKQPLEEHPQKVRKQLESHPPLRSGSEIVRSSLGHFLQPSEQGCTVRVWGDGWGGRGDGYLATVTEADASSFTVIRQGGHWEETHVLREHCTFNPPPEWQVEHRHVDSSQSQAKRRRKST
eukprot:TRINITY_DN41671_c0_g1_i1.p1 TRINITY_DN41671_c0_g1~~TRINITY_DN41671_c0_g1_i1.p1  ORF type:complete len:1181 (+),score=252.15 TRINITY_DN41671_c0_g1_i1:81-3623(+)